MISFWLTVINKFLFEFVVFVKKILWTCAWFPCHMSNLNVLINMYKIKIKKRNSVSSFQLWHMHNMQTFISTKINWNAFCYYLKCFLVSSPYHNLTLSFRDRPISTTKASAKRKKITGRKSWRRISFLKRAYHLEFQICWKDLSVWYQWLLM